MIYVSNVGYLDDGEQAYELDEVELLDIHNQLLDQEADRFLDQSERYRKLAVLLKYCLVNTLANTPRGHRLPKKLRRAIDLAIGLADDLGV